MHTRIRRVDRNPTERRGFTATGRDRPGFPRVARNASIDPVGGVVPKEGVSSRSADSTTSLDFHTLRQ